MARAVADHVPGDEREARARLAVLEALDVLAHPFDRHADLTHVTGSAVVVGPRGVLLLSLIHIWAAHAKAAAMAAVSR